MTALFSWSGDAGIDSYTVDAVFSEKPEGTAEITTHTVERGAPISDNVRPDVATLTLECQVTNTPVVRSTTINRVAEADALFNRLLEESTILSVTTSLRRYADMAIKRYSPERDNGTGKALTFALELQRVRIVSAQRVLVEVPEERRGQRRRDRGRQDAQAATEPQLTSIAARGGDAALAGARNAARRLFGG